MGTSASATPTDQKQVAEVIKSEDPAKQGKQENVPISSEKEQQPQLKETPEPQSIPKASEKQQQPQQEKFAVPTAESIVLGGTTLNTFNDNSFCKVRTLYKVTNDFASDKSMFDFTKLKPAGTVKA